MRKQIHALTALRAVAAALVFFYHFVYLRNPVPAQNAIEAIMQNGFIGVNLMFVLSGFLLTLRYYANVEQNNLRWGDYIKRRVIRLYPSYFVLLAGIALLGVPLNLANVTLTQGFFTAYFQTGIINSWSLTAEECFYFVLPVLLWILIRCKTLLFSTAALVVWALGMLVVGLLLTYWAKSSGVGASGGFMDDYFFTLSRTFFGFCIEFAIGMVAALIYRRRGAYGVAVSTLLTVISLVGIAGCIYLMTLYPDSLSVRELRYAVSVFCGILIFALTCEKLFLSRLLSWSPFVYLGRLSYGLYLIQLTQIVWFMADWPVLMFYAGCNAASALLYHLIEEPTRKLFLKRRTPAPVLVAVPQPILAQPSSESPAYDYYYPVNMKVNE
ncbi:MAG: acyltransferase [Chloroflexota bacterium]